MDNISEQLFAKIRGRFPSVTLGDEQGVGTDEPKLARYFDFDYKVGEDSLGKVSISLTEKEIAIMYNNTFISEPPDSIKKEWYDFLKEIRVFSKRNMLNFDTRDITKSNLDKRFAVPLADIMPPEVPPPRPNPSLSDPCNKTKITSAIAKTS